MEKVLRVTFKYALNPKNQTTLSFRPHPRAEPVPALANQITGLPLLAFPNH